MISASAFGVEHTISKAGPKTVAGAARFSARMARKPFSSATQKKKDRAEAILVRNAAKVGQPKRRLP